MHVAGLVDLGHGRIDQRVACPPFAPSGKQRLRPFTVFPRDRIVFRFKSAAGHMREIRQNREVKIAPDQFTEPHSSAMAPLKGSGQRSGGQLANGHRAKSQMHAQIAGAFDSREITRLMVLVHAVKKFCK